MKMRTILSLFAVVILIPLILVFLLYSGLWEVIIVGSHQFRHRNDRNEAFSEIAWKHGSLRQKGRMAKWIIKTDYVVGKTEVEVIELLGAPDYRVQNCLKYLVDSGYGIPGLTWEQTMDVILDEHQVVCEVVMLE